MRPEGFLLVIRETQRTYENLSSYPTSCTVHSSIESHRVRARFIGSGGEGISSIYPIMYYNYTGESDEFSTGIT